MGRVEQIKVGRSGRGESNVEEARSAGRTGLGSSLQDRGGSFFGDGSEEGSGAGKIGRSKTFRMNTHVPSLREIHHTLTNGGIESEELQRL